MTKAELLDVLASYQRMIQRDHMQHPTVVLDDISHSIKHVLEENKYEEPKLIVRVKRDAKASEIRAFSVYDVRTGSFWTKDQMSPIIRFSCTLKPR